MTGSPNSNHSSCDCEFCLPRFNFLNHSQGSMERKQVTDIKRNKRSPALVSKGCGRAFNTERGVQVPQNLDQISKMHKSLSEITINGSEKLQQSKNKSPQNGSCNKMSELDKLSVQTPSSHEPTALTQTSLLCINRGSGDRLLSALLL